MTTCPGCQAPAVEGQRFCEECGQVIDAVVQPPVAPQAVVGAEPACSACFAPLPADHHFCRVCGHAASGPSGQYGVAGAPAMGCGVCGAPVHPGYAFCAGCTAPSAVSHAYPAAYGGQWTAADRAHPAHPPDPYLVAPPTRPRRRPWLVASVALLLLGATGGGIAVALALTKGDESTLAQAEPAREGDRSESGNDDRLDGDSPAADDGPQPSSPQEVPTPSSSEVPDGFFSETGGPTGVMEAHWQSIAAGDYDAAYNTFTSFYSTGRSEWVTDQERYGARVGPVEATTVSEDGDTALVQMSVVTRDAGQGDLSCNRFSGEVLLVRQNGAWRYRPRPPEDDPSYFQRSEAGISSSDSGCAQTFD